MRVGIVGYGAVGRKRDDALSMTDSHVATLDPRTSEHTWESFLDVGIDAVVVSTPNSFLVQHARTAVQNRKHVLIEKPGARSSAELIELQALAAKRGVTVHVGYNLRFHPAIMQARAEIGDETVTRIFGFYGHGGSGGWRAEEGDGASLDLGSHLEDLARWFTVGKPGLYEVTIGAVWDEWAPRFELRIHTPTKLVTVQGLQPGTTYGPESITVTPAALHAPRVTTTYPGPDGSWAREWEAFRQEVASGHPGNLDAAIAVLRALNK